MLSICFTFTPKTGVRLPKIEVSFYCEPVNNYGEARLRLKDTNQETETPSLLKRVRIRVSLDTD